MSLDVAGCGCSRTVLPRTAWTVREVADSTGMAYKAVLRLIKEGRIRARFTGRQYVVPVAALDEFLGER